MTGGDQRAAGGEKVVILVRGAARGRGVLVGGALAVAGTAFQGLFSATAGLADLLGASSGAALGRVLGIFFSLGSSAIERLASAGANDRGSRGICHRSAAIARPIRCFVLPGVVIGALARRAQSDWSNISPIPTTSCRR